MWPYENPSPGTPETYLLRARRCTFRGWYSQVVALSLIVGVMDVWISLFVIVSTACVSGGFLFHPPTPFAAPHQVCSPIGGPPFG